ncbi:septal ring factor EnvC (AmiA/AmiB activator) [Pacificibacter maritimus]|uniref:Septal ring factor EnvC (AmiA/AmiB activator) n=1 Tax=Pacificibacter maritimus TaxID=762213 RepID=A0A3N4UML6_9RHOB|nr:peptidoglycan DD-metalloendopeptidase family protein [Pacificibacter maritimus]RPE63110.1 septal ring factor EnvC (AmiA/AmiB activator) [Pacificibacter maritimus]
MKIMCVAGLILGICVAGAAQAQDASPAALAENALAQFKTAHEKLEKAEIATDRVKALTGVIQAYEDGLEAMRSGLREAALREAEINRKFQDESGQVATLLAVLINLKPDASPAALVHPTGPLGHARAGMLVSSITPAMQEQAEILRAQLQEVSILRELQNEALDVLEAGLKDVQSARTDLSQAMSNRTDLPRRFVADAERVQELINGSDTLEAFASSLAVMDVVDGTSTLPDLDTAKGRWPLPSRGRILRRFDETDAAGVQRPGWLLATRPLSLVTSPWPATIRYQGAFLDYGNVIILEPGNDVLIVLAGLDEVYGDVGSVIPAGSAVGLMSGTSPDLDAFVTNATQGTGAGLSETLYIEVREGGKPVDPAQWFANEQ